MCPWPLWSTTSPAPPWASSPTPPWASVSLSEDCPGWDASRVKSLITAGPGLCGAQRPLVAGLGRGEGSVLWQRGVLWEPHYLVRPQPSSSSSHARVLRDLLEPRAALPHLKPCGGSHALGSRSKRLSWLRAARPPWPSRPSSHLPVSTVCFRSPHRLLPLPGARPLLLSPGPMEMSLHGNSPRPSVGPVPPLFSGPHDASRALSPPATTLDRLSAMCPWCFQRPPGQELAGTGWPECHPCSVTAPQALLP